MKSHDLWGTVVLTLVATGTVLPGSLLIAAGDTVTGTAAVDESSAPESAPAKSVSNRSTEISVERRVKAARKPEQLIRDVSLNEAGSLTGFVLNPSGQAVARTKVVVRIGRRTVAEAMTDEKGQFEVSGLDGGVYQISHSNGSFVYRVWKTGTAPDSARSTVLLPFEKPVIRAQGLEGSALGTLSTSTILATGGAIAGTTLGIVGFSEANAANDRADAANAQLDALLNTP